jgi:hypothetical protein
MLYGLPQAAGKVALGLAGVTVLAASANSVAIVAEAVRRAFVQGIDLIRGIDDRDINPDRPSKVDEWHVRALMPYGRTESWTALGIAALQNVIVGTAALFLAHRFFPCIVADANTLLHRAIPIQFTPHHIPLFKLFGY